MTAPFAYRKNLLLVRPHSTIEFAERLHHVVEIIDVTRHGARMDVVATAFFDDLKPVSEAEWTEALAKATKAERQRQDNERARAEGEVFGIPATCRGRTVYIVRSTATTLTDNNGGSYSRKDGKQRGGTRWDYNYLREEDLQTIERFLAGRAKVDIVAERKAAAVKPAPA